MITARKCETGKDAGRWFSVVMKSDGHQDRVGYCARGCLGHDSSAEALAHYLQFQLDRETELWVQRPHATRTCGICGVQTTLRARLGRDTELYVLCADHQSSSNLQALFQRRSAIAGTALP